MSKTILITISDDRSGRKGGLYEATQDKVTKIFIKNRLVDEQQPWTISSILNSYHLEPEIYNFYLKNKVMLDNPDAAINGRLYKPFVIKMGLDSIDTGDYLVYNDVSPEMWTMKESVKLGSVYDIEVIKGLCRQANDFLVAFVKWSENDFVENPLGIHTHHYFTLSDCLRIMEGQDYENSFQCASGMICIRKTIETVKIVDEWLMYNKYWKCASVGNPSIPDDKSLWDSKEDYKLGCRHDQSILSILLNKRNWDFVDIVYNDISPYNFLNFCRKDVDYSFINSNIKL